MWILLEDFIYFTYEHINVRLNVAALIINVVTLKNQVSYFNCTNICVCCMMFSPRYSIVGVLYATVSLDEVASLKFTHGILMANVQRWKPLIDPRM